MCDLGLRTPAAATECLAGVTVDYAGGEELMPLPLGCGEEVSGQ